jgi:hypothetical protein
MDNISTYLPPHSHYKNIFREGENNENIIRNYKIKGKL